MLLLDFDAFLLEHRLCGELDAGVDGPVVWFACECGARIERPVETFTAERDGEIYEFCSEACRAAFERPTS
jgi:hypothetical protein